MEGMVSLVANRESLVVEFFFLLDSNVGLKTIRESYRGQWVPTGTQAQTEIIYMQ